MVDGTLVGATQDSAAINQFLNEQKAPYETGQENLTVRFAHEVELVPGVYFTETLISEEELRPACWARWHGRWPRASRCSKIT